MVRNINQDQADTKRVYYTLNFPNDLDERSIQAWLRSVSTALKKGGGLFSTVQTMVFETWGQDSGIVHLLGLHPDDATHIINQLRTHVEGIRVEPVDRPYPDGLTEVAEIGMTNPGRLLHIPEAKSLSSSLLASVQALQPGEIVITQWVITPTKDDTLKRDFSGNVRTEKVYTVEGWKKALALAPSGQAYKPIASSEEIRERTDKLAEPNMSVIGRVAAYSPIEGRAEKLVPPVVKVLRSAKSPTTTFKAVPAVFHNAVTATAKAATPSSFPGQLNVVELSAVIGWPIGRPHVAGLPHGSSRHLPANESIPREGRVLGQSNFPGNERPIAIGRLESLKHLHVMGPTGVGKTTLLSSLVRQDMEAGYGVIVMESKSDLFHAALNLVPTSRIDDVIILDPTDTTPPGFNLLDQGNPQVVIDQLSNLFQNLYNSGGKDIWFRELLYFGLQTLAEHPGMTFVDLATLITPRTADEVAWSDYIKATVKHKEIREFWQLRWNKMDAKERERNAAPLHNRIWQLVSRSELRNIIGQSVSSFQMDDVLRNNKILLINLAGVPSEAASLAGTLIMNALWSSAQRVNAETPNYVYLDEFQDFIRLPVSAEDMLAKARGFNLSLTLAHQHFGQLPSDVQSAIIANARSKLYFQTSAEDARTVQRSLGSDAVGESDLMSLGTYEAYARLAVGAGASSPVSLMTAPPSASTGNREAVLNASRSKYGRSIADIEKSIIERRKPGTKESGNRPRIVTKW